MRLQTQLLDRLTKVKKSAANRWIACCPAHPDRAPSLSIAESPDGRILLHCHAGCETADVLAAVGLSFSDLFPGPLTRYYLPGVQMQLSAAEALTLVRHEAQVVAILAAQVQAGGTFTEVAADRLHEAVGRINETYARVGV